jgi:uncharacterized membrane protein YdbT with pleckstrin-like domain
VRSYIDDNLLPGEKVLARRRVSPASAYFAGGVLLGAGVLFSLIAIIAGVGGLFVLFVLFMVIPGACYCIGGYIRVQTSEFALTDRRVIAKEGMVRHKSFDIMLAKVEGVGADQGLLGRQFGYGDITVSGTGGSKDPFKGIENPYEFRTAIQTKLEELQSHN